MNNTERITDASNAVLAASFQREQILVLPSLCLPPFKTFPRAVSALLLLLSFMKQTLQ